MFFQVQGGQSPKVCEILAVRDLFSRPPLGIKRMNVDHMVSKNSCSPLEKECPPQLSCYCAWMQRQLSPLLFLTPRLPAFLIGRRLSSHALELLQLDRALARLGPHQLTDSEIREVRHSTVWAVGFAAVCDHRIFFLISGLLFKGDQFSRASGQPVPELVVSVASSVVLTQRLCLTCFHFKIFSGFILAWDFFFLFADSEVSLLLHSLVFLSANYPTSSGPHTKEVWGNMPNLWWHFYSITGQ